MILHPRQEGGCFSCLHGSLDLMTGLFRRAAEEAAEGLTAGAEHRPQGREPRLCARGRFFQRVGE